MPVSDYERHCEAAEKLLRSTTHYYNGGQTRRDEPPTELDVQRAQVHATLALAAATRG